MFTMNSIQYEAKWNDVVDLYNIDRSIPDVRMLPRLTEFHVTPDKIPLMKVKNAAQVLSHRVASIMLFLSSRLKKIKIIIRKI